MKKARSLYLILGLLIASKVCAQAFTIISENPNIGMKTPPYGNADQLPSEQFLTPRSHLSDEQDSFQLHTHTEELLTLATGKSLQN